MTTLSIFRGLPGSGKSTWAQVSRSSGEVIVERDILRKDNPQLPDEQPYHYENRITKLQHSRIRALLNMGIDVISSDTNLRDKYVKPLLGLAHEAGAHVEWIDLRDVPLAVCLERNAARDNPVPEEYIRTCYDKFIKGKALTHPEYVPKPVLEIEPYEQSKSVRYNRAYIFDIDGTLATKHPDRDIYDGTKVHMDLVNEDVARVLRDLYNSETVYVMSGRSAEHYEATKNWLLDHDLYNDGLFMRAECDKRDDAIVKYELFNTHIRPKQHYIAGVYDDRDRVVAMWRKLGLTCFQVAPGNF